MLFSELSRFQGIVEKKTPIPVLECILLTLKGRTLEIVGTDLNTTLRCETTVNVAEREGVACIAFRRLYDLVRLLPDGDIKVQREENGWTTVISGRSRYKLPGADWASFPPVPDNKPGELFQTPAPILKSISHGTTYAIPPEEDSQYLLKGAKFELNSNGARMVSTDGHRLAIAESVLEEEPLEDLNIVIPHSGLRELSRLLTDFDGNVNINCEDNHIYFSTGKRVLTTRMMVGSFPNYGLILERNVDCTKINFASAAELAVTLRRAALASDDRSTAVLFTFEDNKLFLSALDDNKGESFESIDILYTGEKTQLLVNSRYVLEFLTLLEQNSVTIGVKGEGHQIYLTAQRGEISYQSIIMPMRI